MYNPPDPPNELLACFDEDGNITESHTRAEVHQDPVIYWHAVVNVWLVNKIGQVFCSLRSKNLKGNPGKWQTYFGGHVKAGNAYKETAIQELDEEIGLAIDPKKLHLIATEKNEPAKHFSESYAYLFDGPIENLKFNDGEIEAVKWFYFEEYNIDKERHPDKWCNGINSENQNKIKSWLKNIS